MNSNIYNRFILLSTTISFLLLSYSLIVLANNTTKGYEVSIYSATPIIFWFAILFNLLNGHFLIASCIYGKNGKKWIVGLFQIVFCNISVISLYALRGYVLYFGRGDILTYVGLAKDVGDFGTFGSNFYPITSILISQISQLSKLPIIDISKYIPALFYVFYVLSIYCWSKSLIANRNFILSSLIASTPIFFAGFSTSIYHQVLSVLTLPFFFYLLQRKQDYRFRLFSIIFLIIYPFFHPITGIIVLLYLTIFFISEKFNVGDKKKNISTTLMSLSFTSLIAWFIQQYALLGTMKSVFFQLINLLKTPTTWNYARDNISRLGLMPILRSLAMMITDEIIFSLISLVVIYRVLLRRGVPILQKFYKTSLCFVIGNLFLLILFFSTRTHRPERLINLNFNLMLTPPLVGYLLYKFLFNNKRAKAVLILSLIFISSVTAIFSLYPSPITMLSNEQVTIRDVTGMNWLITQKNPEIKTACTSSSIRRFADLIYGVNFRKQRQDLVRDWIFSDHFGFTNDEPFPIDEDRYLIVTAFDVNPYIMEIRKGLEPELETEDFIKINSCNNVDKIYENGEFISYFVHKDG